MERRDWSKFTDALKKELQVAQGCTEPGAIALVTAKCAELLGTRSPDRISVFLSRNVFKNAFSVTVPGTDCHGCEFSAALGAVGGDSSLGLEALKKVDAGMIQKAENLISQKRCTVSVKDVPDSVYVEANLSAGSHHAKAIIQQEHTNFTFLQLDDKMITDQRVFQAYGGEGEDECAKFALSDIFEFAQSVPVEEIAFLNRAKELNCALSREGRDRPYGLQLGRVLEGKLRKGDTPESLAIARCAAGIDARMAGCPMPAVINSGSGNQGITATVPVCVVAECLGSSEEQLLRALALSHMTAIYMKYHLDRLTAMCGAISAAAGAGCAVAYLRGGGFQAVRYTVINTIANITGMICDGAKSSCSLKVAAALQAAFCAVDLALSGTCVDGLDGIVSESAETAIDNFGTLASAGMKETDRVILEIMLEKSATA